MPRDKDGLIAGT